MSQRDRILEMLEQAGEKGVHSFEFYEQRMPRGAAVICDLRKEGYPIESVNEKYNGDAQGVRYFLRSTQLFDMPERRKSSASYYMTEAA